MFSLEVVQNYSPKVTISVCYYWDDLYAVSAKRP